MCGKDVKHLEDSEWSVVSLKHLKAAFDGLKEASFQLSLWQYHSNDGGECGDDYAARVMHFST